MGPNPSSFITIKDKNLLRTQYLKKRRNLSKEELTSSFKKIMKRFLSLPLYDSAQIIMAYYGKIEDGEFDTTPLLKKILKDGKILILPRCADDAIQLEMYEIRNLSHDIEKSKFGIYEPSPIHTRRSNQIPDIIIVPGIVFDRRGGRLGYGKGYYDHFFNFLEERSRTAKKSSFKTVALVSEGFLLGKNEKLPLEPHDRIIDIIITENETIVTQN